MQGVANAASTNQGSAEIFSLKIAHSILPTKSLQYSDPLEPIKHTDWYFLYIETIDVRLCSYENLNAAYSEAPTDAAAGYIRAIFDIRSLQAVLTGVAFN
jgi:hypothetical protein